MRKQRFGRGARQQPRSNVENEQPPPDRFEEMFDVWTNTMVHYRALRRIAALEQQRQPPVEAHIVAAKKALAEYEAGLDHVPAQRVLDVLHQEAVAVIRKPQGPKKAAVFVAAEILGSSERTIDRHLESAPPGWVMTFYPTDARWIQLRKARPARRSKKKNDNSGGAAT